MPKSIIEKMGMTNMLNKLLKSIRLKKVIDLENDSYVHLVPSWHQHTLSLTHPSIKKIHIYVYVSHTHIHFLSLLLPLPFESLKTNTFSIHFSPYFHFCIYYIPILKYTFHIHIHSFSNLHFFSSIHLFFSTHSFFSLFSSSSSLHISFLFHFCIFIFFYILFFFISFTMKKVHQSFKASKGKAII